MQNKVSKGFESTDIHLGTIKAGETVASKFIYKGPNSDIEEVRKGCGGCTKLAKRIQKKDKTIIPFTYSDSHVANAGARDKYPNGIINVTKTITIFFKDGEQRLVTKGTTQQTNPDKEVQVLTYRVDVSIKE